MQEFLIQAIGFLAVIMYLVSFQFKSNRALFSCQLVGNLLFALQFLLLGAASGALNLLVSRVRSLKGGYNVRYALFSASGFTDELREYAEENGILLFGQRELLYKDEMPDLR